MVSSRAAAGKTNRTFEIAMRSNLQQTDASVLLVLGTQPAIIRTAFFDIGSVPGRDFAGQAVLGSVKPGDIAADKIFTRSVSRAVFAEIDTIISNNDLGLNQCQAFGTKALSHAQKIVISVLHGMPYLDWR
jgi:hypothetical protein